MSWPFLPRQCPDCAYFHRLDPPWEEDDGYVVPGLCRHPRIAMELFDLRERRAEEVEPCRLFRGSGRPRRGP